MNSLIVHSLLLYTAGSTENSMEAVANLLALCRNYLPGRHRIEIVDVFKEPKRALADRIFMTPVLVHLSPGPVRRIVGTLRETEKVVTALGLELHEA